MVVPGSNIKDLAMTDSRQMIHPDAKLGRKLTRRSKRQSDLLELIYAYRYVTTRQVQLFLGMRHIQQAQQRLNTLRAKGYVDRRFSSEDRLLGRYASYYLSLAGLKLLKRYGSPRALKNMRKDGAASESFVKHSLAIGDVAADLSRIYHDAIRFRCFTKNELLREDANNNDGSDAYEPLSRSFPQPLPDLYIDYMHGEDNWDQYVAEIWHATVPFWVYRKRIQYYMEYVNGEKCQEAFCGKLPPVLLICDTLTLQRRVQRYLRRIADGLDEDELKFLVANRPALHEAQADTELWTVTGEDGSQAIKLVDISE